MINLMTQTGNATFWAYVGWSLYIDTSVNVGFPLVLWTWAVLCVASLWEGES